MHNFDPFLNTKEFESAIRAFQKAIALNEHLIPKNSVMKLSFNFWRFRKDYIEGGMSIRDIKIEEYES